MTFLGDTKQAYCPVCNCETTWIYTQFTRPDGLLGLQNAMDPTPHQVTFWRCANHSTLEGRIKPEFKKGTHHESYLAHR